MLAAMSQIAFADNNPNNNNDLKFDLNNGQTVQIHWHNAALQSGPKNDNPFQLKVWNSVAGSDHLEDLKGTSPNAQGVCPDFFAFSMTDMDMPDPAKVYKKPRHIVRSSTGIYEITSGLFSMDSMQAGDWQIDVMTAGKSIGHGDLTVGNP